MRLGQPAGVVGMWRLASRWRSHATHENAHFLAIEPRGGPLHLALQQGGEVGSTDPTYPPVRMSAAIHRCANLLRRLHAAALGSPRSVRPPAQLRFEYS